MQLIAVVMGAETRDERNAAARAMLDAGFAGYALCEFPAEYLEEVPVIGGKTSTVSLYSGGFSVLVESSKKGKIEEKFDIPETVKAPLQKGSKVGKITYILDGEVIGECNITVDRDVESVKYSELILGILKRMVSGK
jgi:D-alanyl-D-alanine carboxypeptidase (penicillin-binding protein 5/6)